MLPINGNVAENSLSMHDLDAVHAWVNHVDNNKVEDKEAANIIDWMDAHGHAFCPTMTRTRKRSQAFSHVGLSGRHGSLRRTN